MKQYLSTEAVMIRQYMTSQFIHEAILSRHTINTTYLNVYTCIIYCSIIHYMYMYMYYDVHRNELDAIQSVFHGIL